MTFGWNFGVGGGLRSLGAFVTIITVRDNGYDHRYETFRIDGRRIMLLNFVSGHGARLTVSDCTCFTLFLFSVNYCWTNADIYRTLGIASLDFLLQRLAAQSATSPDIQPSVERADRANADWNLDCMLRMAAEDWSHRTPSVKVASIRLEAGQLHAATGRPSIRREDWICPVSGRYQSPASYLYFDFFSIFHIAALCLLLK